MPGTWCAARPCGHRRQNFAARKVARTPDRNLGKGKHPSKSMNLSEDCALLDTNRIKREFQGCVYSTQFRPHTESDAARISPWSPGEILRPHRDNRELRVLNVLINLPGFAVIGFFAVPVSLAAATTHAGFGRSVTAKTGDADEWDEESATADAGGES
jgi:hypothetical protein